MVHAPGLCYAVCHPDVGLGDEGNLAKEAAFADLFDQLPLTLQELEIGGDSALEGKA